MTIKLYTAKEVVEILLQRVTRLERTFDMHTRDILDLERKTQQLETRLVGHKGDKRMDTMIGKTVKKITGLEEDSSQVVFEFTDGTQMRMHHEQECCEGVWLSEVNGEADDLIGCPIVVAEERTQEMPQNACGDDSGTWTFYTIRTIKGTLDMRWNGESSGYYSESVDIDWSVNYDD